MARSWSSQWWGAAEHDQRNDGDPLGDHDASSDSADVYYNPYVKTTSWQRKRASAGATEHDEEHALAERPRQRKRGEDLQDLDPEIQIFKFNKIDADHIRTPDLSADIRVVFPTEEYIGAYVSHGQTKTVFAIRSSSRKEGKFDGAVLKIRRGYDIEPSVMRQVQGLTPKLLYECIGKDGNYEYHCWVTERCIPLHRLAVLQSTCNKNACVLAACRCIARAALCRLLLSDCHYYNLGVRITPSTKEHEVVIIDVGSRNIAESVPTKREVKCAMHKVWKWTEKEIQAPPTSTRVPWSKHEHTLQAITQRLDTAWRSQPYLTATKVPTSHIDQDITAKCSRALREFNQSPQGKVVELIGRSSVEWMGGAWNDRLSEICMRAAEEAHTTFDADEERVLTELYERMTKKRMKHECVPRTKEEIETIVAFWWKLQTYRRQRLERQCRVDTAEEVLSETEIQKVKRDWEDCEMWWDLSAKQRKIGHLPSIYNAALHNKSGWAAVANAIIKYRLPQLPHLRKSDGVAEHIQIIDKFCCDMLEWMKKFAGAALAYWRTTEYKSARATSGTG